MKTEVHLHKYKNFKAEAATGHYPPSRIENYFLACFHLIEAFVFFKAGLHIQKHQKIRTILEENKTIFGEETERVWREFEELENQVRVATSYGGKENGKMVEMARKILENIEDICGDMRAKGI